MTDPDPLARVAGALRAREAPAVPGGRMADDVGDQDVEEAPARPRRIEDYQPEAFKTNIMARGINRAANFWFQRRYGVDAGQHQLGESWTAALFYAIGAQPGASHPYTNAVVHTAEYAGAVGLAKAKVAANAARPEQSR